MAQLKIFPIEFVREILERKLLDEHLQANSLFGGKDQIALCSFYEQLKSQEEVDRFVETYRDLSEQQNRLGLIGNGVILSPENPTYTNLYSATIIPMTWTCSIRCTLGNRDQMVNTINNLSEKLKGRKLDMVQLSVQDENGATSYVPFVVGTLGQYSSSIPYINNGDFVGYTSITNMSSKINELVANGLTMPTLSTTQTLWVYFIYNGVLRVALNYYDSASSSRKWKTISDDGTYGNVVFPPENNVVNLWKVSMSFDSLRCDEPRNLNAEEYCEISFGGSATIVNNGVKLGNDLIKVKVSKTKIVSNPDITFDSNSTYLEPLEMPSGNNANTNPISLVSNKFLANTHTDSVALSLQYTFICDDNIDLLSQWFDYARYGAQGLTVNDISPNIIYTITEYWSACGEFKSKTFKAKIVESIDIENTESDTLTISVPFQLQGDNN